MAILEATTHIHYGTTNNQLDKQSHIMLSIIISIIIMVVVVVMMMSWCSRYGR